MDDYVKKVIPYSPREKDALEAWLEEQAREGLYVEKDWIFGLRFRGKPAASIRYRLDETWGGSLEQRKRRREQLLEEGFRYVMTMRGGADIYQNDDLSRWELPEQEEELKKRRRLMKRVSVLFSILLCGVLLYIYLNTTFLGKTTLDFVTKGFYEWPSLLLLLLLCLFAFLESARITRRVKKRKKDGTYEKRCYHNRERAWHGKRYQAALWCLVLLVPVANTILNHVKQDRWEFIPLESYQMTLPVPQLSELLGMENALRRADGRAELTEDKHLKRNELATNRYVLMPLRVMLYQGSEAYGRSGTTGAGVYYDAFYYELRTEGLAKRVMEDLRKEYAYVPLPANQEGEAFFYRAEKEALWPGQALLFRSGKQIVRVFYGGELDLSRYTALFARYLNAQKEPQEEVSAALRQEKAERCVLHGLIWTNCENLSHTLSK